MREQVNDTHPEKIVRWINSSLSQDIKTQKSASLGQHVPDCYLLKPMFLKRE